MAEGAHLRAGVDAPLIPALVDVWNAAWGRTFPLRIALLRQNTLGDPHFDPEGLVVAQEGPAGPLLGWALAKAAGHPFGPPGCGWIGALVVHPAAQGQGIGTALLRRAEEFLKSRGKNRAVLGGGPAHFFPGVPVEPPDRGGGRALSFFERRGYRFSGTAYDLHRSLADYRTPPRVEAVLAAHPGVTLRPLGPGERRPLLGFLAEVFPGRWTEDIRRFLEEGGEISDILGILDGAAVLGFAHLHPPGSRRIGPSVAWARKSERLGGIGPLGIAPSLRGRGLGLALLDRALLRLREFGATQVVVDWTVLLDFYGRLGFVPIREYRHGARDLR